MLAAWVGFEGRVIQGIVLATLPPELIPTSPGQASLTLSQISNVAAGKLNPDFVPEGIAGAASLLETLRSNSATFKTVLVLLIAVLGGTFAWFRVMPQVNARVSVEATLRRIFFVCAAVAVLTTVGIVFSVILKPSDSSARFPLSISSSEQTGVRRQPCGLIKSVPMVRSA